MSIGKQLAMNSIPLVVPLRLLTVETISSTLKEVRASGSWIPSFPRGSVEVWREEDRILVPDAIHMSEYLLSVRNIMGSIL